MTLNGVIDRYRGQPMGGAISRAVNGPGQIGTPLQPVTPQLPQIPWNQSPAAPGGTFDPASYLNPYHPNPYGNQAAGQFPSLYGNPQPGGQPAGPTNLQMGKLPAQPRTYGV